MITYKSNQHKLSGSIFGRSLIVNDIVMVVPYKYKFRVGGIRDVTIDDELVRLVSFPMNKGGKIESKEKPECELFLDKGINKGEEL